MSASQPEGDVRPGPNLLTIGSLSRETGIPVPTLRTWERRYGQPTPLRRPSGHRLYPAEWVERLRRVAFLLEQGHRAASVLAMPLAQLDSLVALSQARPAAPRLVPDAPMLLGEDPAIVRLMRATRRLDRELLMAELRLEWGRLGPLGFLSGVAGPFMTQIGEEWRRGELDVRYEHFASACLRGLLHELRQPYDQAARGDRVVVATLPGDLHDLGLLMAALVLAMRGRRVLYMGADLPVHETARTAVSQNCTAVAVSVSNAYGPERGAAQIGMLREHLPAGIALWVGGAGAPTRLDRCEVFASLEHLDASLAGGAR